MTPLCSKGHELAGDNLVIHGKRKRCKTCKREYERARRGGLKGTNPLIEASQALTRNRIEDIEDLLSFGATFHEIVSRSGYTKAGDIYRVLRNAGKHDVLEKLKQRREASAVGSQPISSINGGQSTSNARGRNKL